MQRCGLCAASCLVLWFFGAPLPTLAQSSAPAQFQQMKAQCRASGGTPAAEHYNGWVSGGGCICPPARMGSGQVTCSASGGMTPDGAAAQQLGQLGAQMILQGLGLTPEARAAEEARHAEALAEEQRRRAEEDQRRSESRDRLLSSMKDLDSGPSSLSIKFGEPRPESSAPLALKLDRPKPVPLSEEERLIRTFLALATQLGWRGEELARFERGLRNLALDKLDITRSGVRDTWDNIERRSAAEFAALASQGQGPGLPGAGRQNHEDCAIFALANATRLPYGVVAARAGELIRQGTWRSPAERANPNATMERGLNGGEVVMLAESFGRAEILTPEQFPAALRDGRTVMVNVAPRGFDGGHQVVLTRTFHRRGEIWYEMMDSNQGPMQRRYLSAGELDGILQEKGIAWQPDPGRTPALLR